MKISTERQSVLAIVAGLLVIAIVKHSPVFFWAAVIVSLSFPFRLLNRTLHQAWMALSKLLGAISSNIILFVLFFFFLVPLSVARKFLSKQDSLWKFDGDEKSYFHSRNHLFTPTDFSNPW